jgi:hypothetical protein
MNKQKMMLTLNKLKFKTVKYSPEIFMYAGAVGVIGAGVLACKSTLKLNSVIDSKKSTIKQIHDLRDSGDDDYTEQDAKKDLAIVYTSTALDIAKLYAPAVILGGISLAAMIQSHNILNKRNAALAAALTTATESFNRYRKNVVERYGEDIDRELRYGIKKEKITTVDENGKTKKETVDVVKNGLEDYSDYARFYDDGCNGWSKDPDYNKMFLKAQQQYANDKLVAQGYLFLSDVYNMLGIPESKASRVVGWVYNPENPDGDNYVDFGIFDVTKENSRDFVNGYEPVILLDFNVDGNIWDKM